MGAAMEPRVTFIIAHHNYQHYLPQAIQSAVNQTYENIHICIIDDCSDDQESVLDIIHTFTGQKMIDIEHGNNIITYRCDLLTYVQLLSGGKSYGPSYARNRGIEACWDTTDIFAILDADDENYPTKIERSIEVLQCDPRIGAVYTDTNILQVTNNRIVREYREPYDYTRLLQECIVHSGCVIPKQVLENILEDGVVFDESMSHCEAYDLWVRISEKFLFYHIPEALVLVRVHAQNSTETSSSEHRISKLQHLFNKRAIRNQCHI